MPVRFAVASLEWILDSGTRRAITDEERPQNLLVAIEGINDRSEPGASMPPAVPGVRFRRTDRLVPPATKPGEPLVAVASTRWVLIGDRHSLRAVLGGKGRPA